MPRLRDSSGRMIEIYFVIAGLGLLMALVIPAIAQGGALHGLWVGLKTLGVMAGVIGALWAIAWVWDRFPLVGRVGSIVVPGLGYAFVCFLMLCVVGAALQYSLFPMSPSTIDRLTLAIAILSLPLGGFIASNVVPGLRRVLWASVSGVLLWAFVFFGLFLATSILFEGPLQRHFAWIAGAEFAAAALAGGLAGLRLR